MPSLYVLQSEFISSEVAVLNRGGPSSQTRLNTPRSRHSPCSVPRVVRGPSPRVKAYFEKRALLVQKKRCLAFCSMTSKGAWKHAVAGAAAGSVSVLANHPLDVVKVRLQVQDGSNPKGTVYRGFFHALKTIKNTEGLRGLYAGLAPNLVGATVSWGVYFYSYNQAKRRYQNWFQTERLSAPLHLLSGFEAGGVVALVTNPIWVVKTRMALQRKSLLEGSPLHGTEPAQYTGMRNALWRIAREEGLAGLYKGLGPSMFLVSHGALQFMAYEEIKRAMVRWHATCAGEQALACAAVDADHAAQQGVTRGVTRGVTMGVTSAAPASARAATPSTQPTGDLLPMEHAAAAVISKIGSSTVTYPWQVVRSRQQQRMDPARQSQYQSMATTFKSVLMNEGVSGLYKGLVPNTVRVLPASAITFVVYEAVSKMLNGVQDSS